MTVALAGGNFGERAIMRRDSKVMADRVVIVRTGEHLVSLPFDHIDEILGTDRIESVKDLPDGVAPGDSDHQHWVFSRGTWLPVGTLLPDTGVSGSSQIVVVRWDDVGRAFAVDQVLGIEALGEATVFPERANSCTDIPIAGVHSWKDGFVLELDLSRLISLDIGS